MSSQSSLLRSTRAVLSRRPAAFVTDVDGTISRIVDQPDRAVVGIRARGFLRDLIPHLELVAAVSGRSVGQLRAMLDVDGMVYVGNHGLEWWEDGRGVVLSEAKPYLQDVSKTLEWLRAHLDLPGIQVEDKSVSATVHFRLCDDPLSARRTILRTIAACPSARALRVADGRMVVNLLPPVHADKGTAVEGLIRLRQLRGIIYLGDDVTDLDAFRTLRALRASGACATLAVAVASDEALADVLREADYTLDGVEAVASFLEQVANWANRV